MENDRQSKEIVAKSVWIPWLNYRVAINVVVWINNIVRRDLIIHANLNSLARVDVGEKRLIYCVYAEVREGTFFLGGEGWGLRGEGHQ